MFVIEVMPLRRGVHIEKLSYFSSESYENGTVLSVPVRNQEIKGIVTGVQTVSGAKTALRAATFSLRKLPPQKDVSALSPAFIKLSAVLSDYYACRPGAVLYALLPPEIRDGKIHLPHTHHVEATEQHTPEVLEGTSEERYLTYRSLVRETFAHAGSLLLVVPSSIDAKVAAEKLSAGIEERVVVLTSAMTIKALRESYKELEDFSKQKLIIATPSHAMLERHDIMLMVVERPNTNSYRGKTRPYLDHRHVLREYAKITGRRLLFADLLPRTEEESLRRDEVLRAYGETPKRIALPGTLLIVRMKDKPAPTLPFKLFGKKVLNAIEETRGQKGRTFLFAARRGLAPVVACVDCGHIFRSPDSGAPYSLYKTKKDGREERWFICSVSGHRERAADVCPDCGSWRLKERGIGIQYVYEELQKSLPGVPIILFDHTSANTFKKALFLEEKFYATKGSLLLGTYMALPYLTKEIETSVIVNTDALRASPTWRQQEETLSLLLLLRERTTGTVFVQTRAEPDDLLEIARQGSVERFYNEEIELRKVFNYPPFSHFVHLTWQGKKEDVDQTEVLVKEVLRAHTVNIYSAPPSPKGLQTKYGLIRVPSVDWPKMSLVAALRSLPPSVRIMMNPDRIV